MGLGRFGTVVGRGLSERPGGPLRCVGSAGCVGVTSVGGAVRGVRRGNVFRRVRASGQVMPIGRRRGPAAGLGSAQVRDTVTHFRLHRNVSPHVVGYRLVVNIPLVIGYRPGMEVPPAGAKSAGGRWALVVIET